MPNEMKMYCGTKLINAKPMTRAEYNVFRGWTLPENENGEDKGYLVEYFDGGKANTLEYKGYVSWSPEDVFNDTFRADGNFSFGHALELLKRGYKVARSGWNGKGMFLFLVNGSEFKVNRPPLLGIYPEGTLIEYRAHVDMKTADGSIVPWVCSQSDRLEEDWVIVE